MRRAMSKGFTLLELMIVVIILAILATIAVASFTSHYQQSKSSEVYAILRDIAAKQDGYRAEFGQYLDVSGANALNFADRRPPNTPTGSFGFVVWDRSSADPIYVNYRILGVNPQGAVRFGYIVAAGLPGQAPAGDMYPAGLVSSTNDHWWAAIGLGNYDLDAATAPNECSQHYLSSTQDVLGVVGATE